MILKCLRCPARKAAHPYKSSAEKPMLCEACRGKAKAETRVKEQRVREREALLSRIFCKKARVVER